MKKRNIKMFIALALITTLGTGSIITRVASVADTSSQVNIQQALAKESSVLFPKDKKAAVTLWAEALTRRDASFRYAILTDELKKQEYNKYNEMNWVIGGSSPWILGYTIKENNKIDDKTYEYEIDYAMTDSTKASYSSHENIIVTEMGNNWFVTKHDNYDYLPNVAENLGSKFSELQLPVINDSLLPRDKFSTVNLWAEALKERNGAFRFAILNNDLKKQEYAKYSEMNWVIGGSSPRVISYKVNERGKVDNTTQYEIEYTLTDSTKAIYYAHENLTVTEFGKVSFVTAHDNYDYLPSIEKSK